MNPEFLLFLQQLQQNMRQSMTAVSTASGTLWNMAPFQRDVIQQARRMIHSETGPAVRLDNGTVLYFWHGVNVPEFVIMNSEKITLKHIVKENNLELRRVLIERFGQGKFIKELGAEKIHEDKYGILWEAHRDKLMLNKFDSLSDADVTDIFGRNRRIKYVQVKDASTPREYFIPIPSTMKTAKAAVAWSFGMKEENYNPSLET